MDRKVGWNRFCSCLQVKWHAAQAVVEKNKTLDRETESSQNKPMTGKQSSRKIYRLHDTQTVNPSKLPAWIHSQKVLQSISEIPLEDSRHGVCFWISHILCQGGEERGRGGVSENGSLLIDLPLLAFHYHPAMVFTHCRYTGRSRRAVIRERPPTRLITKALRTKAPG